MQGGLAFHFVASDKHSLVSNNLCGLLMLLPCTCFVMKLGCGQ